MLRTPDSLPVATTVTAGGGGEQSSPAYAAADEGGGVATYAALHSTNGGVASPSSSCSVWSSSCLKTATVLNSKSVHRRACIIAVPSLLVVTNGRSGISWSGGVRSALDSGGPARNIGRTDTDRIGPACGNHIPTAVATRRRGDDDGDGSRRNARMQKPVIDEPPEEAEEEEDETPVDAVTRTPAPMEERTQAALTPFS